jgi:hypothetical protein
MLLVENMALARYTAGTIQMVPGRDGYEPASRGDDPGEQNATRTSLEARRQHARKLDETYETTYTENRRLSSSGTSNIGTFIDLYA